MIFSPILLLLKLKEMCLLLLLKFLKSHNNLLKMQFKITSLSQFQKLFKKSLNLLRNLSLKFRVRES